MGGYLGLADHSFTAAASLRQALSASEIIPTPAAQGGNAPVEKARPPIGVDGVVGSYRQRHGHDPHP